MSISSSVGVLLYSTAGAHEPRLLFCKNHEGKLAVPTTFSDSQEHQSSVAATVLGKANEAALLKTIQNYRGRTSVVTDTANRRVMYLAQSPNGGREGSLDIPPGHEWISLTEVENALNNPAGSSTQRFSREFLHSGRLLLGKDRESNLLQHIREDGSVSGVVKGRPGYPSTVQCHLTPPGCKMDGPARDSEFTQAIDTDNARFTLHGQTYKISLVQGGKKTAITDMDPEALRNLLQSLRNTAQQTAPDQFEDVKKIVFNFKNMEWSNTKFFSNDPDKAIHTASSSRSDLATLREELNSSYKDASIKMGKRKAEENSGIPVGGVPRQLQTCWLGTVVHLVTHLHGERLEFLSRDRKLPEEKNRLLEHLLMLKRKAKKQINGSITLKEVNQLMELSRPLTEEGWNPNRQQDPSEYLDLVLDYLGINGGRYEEITPQADMPATFIRDKIGTDSTASDIRIKVSRNAGDSKNTHRLPVERRIELAPDVIYELTAASVHHGATATNGHYTSYVNHNGTYWHCNDAYVEEAKDDAAIQQELETNATELVYRRIYPAPHRERDIIPIHSTSKTDRAKWLGGNILIDYARHKLGVSVLLNGESPYRTGQDSNIAPLQQAITASADNMIYIPLYKNRTHWTLLVVDKTSNSIDYFDSVGREAPQEVRDLAAGLGFHLNCALTDATRWQQKGDGWRCGYYTLNYLQQRSEGISNAQLVQPDVNGITDFRIYLQGIYNRFEPHCGFND